MKWFVPAAALCVVPAIPAAASVVAIDMTVNGGITPVVVDYGDTVTVRLYGTVTENTYVPVGSLGLAGYASDILTTGGILTPVGKLFSPTNWDAVYDPRFGIKPGGNVLNPGHLDDVMGHGATVGVPDYPSNTNIGVLPTLLAEGHFTATNYGTTTIDFSNMSALVFTFDGTSFDSVTPTTLLSTSGISVTVIPEPASLAVLGLGTLVLLRRKCRHNA